MILNYIIIKKLLDLDDFGAASPFDAGKKNINNNSDAWGAHTTNKNSKINNEDTDSDDFFPPLPSVKSGGGDLNGKHSLLDDPWATANIAVNTKNALATNLNDPWKNTTQSSASVTNSQTNPWLATTTNSTTTPSLTKDPWASNTNGNGKGDDFDFFTTDRVNTPSSPVSAPITTKADPFDDFFGGYSSESAKNEASTNPWNPSSTSSGQQTQGSLAGNASSKSSNSNGIRKTPESFLGENSSLVNLENLIPTRPKSTNPFGVTPLTGGLSSSTSSGQLNNPFLAQQGKI